MATRLSFILDGRDHLSRVLDRAGDNATRLGRRLLTASINGEAAMNRLGRTTTDRMAALTRENNLGAKSVTALKGALISLAPAAIPVAASLAPVAPAAGAAAVALAAYGAALGPQISAMTEASEAEKKYTEAVAKSGRTSQAAVTAQQEYLRAVKQLPPETRRAAAALSVLKDEYKEWSDDLAADTMTPVTKGMAVLNGLLPKTSGLVKGTGRELDRMMTILAGGMESPGLDRLNGKFESFATRTLRRVNDELVSLMRTGDTGKVGSGAAEFMDYARAQGPLVADTLRNVGRALMNLLQAGSEVGVGMLQVVNGLAGIVAAVPPGAIAAMLQLAVAIKAVQLAAVGVAAARTALAAFGTQLVAMRVAAAAAPGGLAAAGAAIGALSRTAKLAVAGTGIGLLIIALSELHQMGQRTPPDVDKLTSSLGRLGATGQVTGELATQFGTRFEKLRAQMDKVADPSLAESFNNWGSDITGGFLSAGYATEELTASFDAIDKGLANLVSGGKPDQAKAALDRMLKGMNPAQATQLASSLDDYDAALANAAFEARLAADAQGLFGAQAQKVQAKLDAQKMSADGLSQSINALSNATLTARGGIRGMEAALDAADAAFKKNGRTLSENTEAGRSNNQALDDIAASTIKAAESARANGASWATVNGIYDRGHAQILKLTEGVTGNERAAKKLADQILQTPNKTARLKGNIEDLQAKLNTAKSRLATVPDSRKAKVRAEISDLQAKIAQAKRELAAMDGRTATASIMVQYRTSGSKASAFAKSIGGYASGGKPKPGELAWVGEEGPELMRFGGGGTEIYDHRSSMRMVADARSAGRDAGLGLRRGMSVSTDEVGAGGRAMAAAILTGIRAELEIASPSKKTKALAQDAGKGLVVGLTGSKAKIAAVSKDLVEDIWKAWSGTRSTKDSKLVAMVNRDTAKLQGLATKRDALASKIATAKKYASDLTAAARQQASLGSLGLEPEQVTAGSIKAGLSQKLSQIKQFTSYIGQLAKRGLNKSLLRQILDMGPEAGYAYASALVGADKTTFAAINSTQKSIDSGTATLGRVGADKMYDAGKDSAKGFLSGLTSQQAAIEKQMITIAKGMQKAIKQALGIRSPATKMMPHGENATKGLAVGAVRGIPFLDRAMAQVAGRVAATRPVMGAAVLPAGGGGVVYNIQIHIDGPADPVAVGRELDRVLTQYKRTQGVR
ncbi:hypothetical protein ACWGDX_24230 [Streptomyces sp. NPDC055025]